MGRSWNVAGVLAVVASVVLVGIALLDDGSPAGAPNLTTTVWAPTTEAATTTAAPTTAPPPNTTAEPGTIPSPGTSAPATSTPATTVPVDPEVRVLVVNAGAPAGAARRITDTLRAAGWTVLPPTDGPRTTGTLVLHDGEGGLPAARALAVELDLPADAVTPGPDQPWWEPEVNVVLVLGTT